MQKPNTREKQFDWLNEKIFALLSTLPNKRSFFGLEVLGRVFAILV